MQLFIAIAVIWGLWVFRDNILETLYSRFRSSRKDGHNALTYTLSAVLAGLTDHERIVFRDNIDHIYRAIKKIKGYSKEVDVREIESLLNRAQGHAKVSQETMNVFKKTFKIISESASQAPSNLESELTVERIYIFLKDNI